jgi:uncharacterized protein (TIGR03435 family)
MVLLAAISTGLPAQAPASQPSNQPANTFEVASIRPSDPLARAQFQIQPGGTYVIRGATLGLLIEQAWDVRDYQISGGPSWLNINRYDVVAKTTTDAKGDEAPSANESDRMRIRLQALLADRFQLQVHRETKVLPAYSLVVAKGGPKLTENHDPTAANSMQRGIGHLKGKNVGMRFVALTLSRQVDRTVLNETGLTGTYDFELDWAPNTRSAPSADGAAPPPQQDGPTIFTALEEQLGLRLEPRREPVELIVIDRAEKASGN